MLRSAVDAVLAGTAALTDRAKARVTADKPLEALHLIDITLTGAPADKDATAVRKAALKTLANACSGEKLCESLWLKAEIDDADATLAG